MRDLLRNVYDNSPLSVTTPLGSQLQKGCSCRQNVTKLLRPTVVTVY